MAKNMKEVSLTLCSPGHCPTIAVGEKEVMFKDDFGGKVRLTREEFDILKGKIKEGQL